MFMRKAWHAIGVTLLAVSLADAAYAQTQFGKIVSFGDSLSDGGTYTNFFKSLNLPGANQVTRFKFTTNPGNVWVENIANRFGIPLTPNALDGGLNYAEGGARVTLPDPSAQGLSQNSVSVQIDHFLASGGSFRKNDIVTMLIGPNDLFQGGPTAARRPQRRLLLNSDACRTSAQRTSSCSMCRTSAPLRSLVSERVLHRS